MCSTDVIYIVDYAIWKEHETSETLERTKKHSILCFMFYVLPHTRHWLNTSHVCSLKICRRRAAKLRRQHDTCSVIFNA